MRIGNIDKVINQSYAQISVTRTYAAQASIKFRFIRNACFKNILNHTKIEVFVDRLQVEVSNFYHHCPREEE